MRSIWATCGDRTVKVASQVRLRERWLTTLQLTVTGKFGIWLVFFIVILHWCQKPSGFYAHLRFRWPGGLPGFLLTAASLAMTLPAQLHARRLLGGGYVKVQIWIFEAGYAKI